MTGTTFAPGQVTQGNVGRIAFSVRRHVARKNPGVQTEAVRSRCASMQPRATWLIIVRRGSLGNLLIESMRASRRDLFFKGLLFPLPLC
jgi:hypothetical protein